MNSLGNLFTTVIAVVVRREQEIGRRVWRVGSHLYRNGGRQNRILWDNLMEWYTGWNGLGPDRSLEGHHMRAGLWEGLLWMAAGFNGEGSCGQIHRLEARVEQCQRHQTKRQVAGVGCYDLWCWMQQRCRGNTSRNKLTEHSLWRCTINSRRTS